MPPSKPEAPPGRVAPDKDLLFRILRELDDYSEGRSKNRQPQLSCLIPGPLNEAIQKFADSFASTKITKSHVVAYALLQFAKQHNLLV